MPHKRKLISKVEGDRNAVSQMELLGRFNSLMSSIKSGDKLGDDHINAANELLQSQFPDIQGLCTPVLGQQLYFPNFDRTLGYAGIPYIQVLHTGADHWIAIQITSDDEVNIYDSLF